MGSNSLRPGTAVGMERITSLDDPRVAAYRSLRDRTLRGESIFVAEGRLVTLRLLESGYQTDSVLTAEKYAEEFSQRVGDRAPLYVAAESLLREVVGFNFHRGVLAAGRRGTPLALESLMARLAATERLSLVVCPEITQPENMGLVFRSAAGFGVNGVLLGRRCYDPLCRRSLRLSMGAVLRMPFIPSPDLLADLGRLKDRWGFQLLAAVLDRRAVRLAEVRWPPRAAVLLGNEAEGLRPEWLSLCDQCVTIPMHPAVDSLNLGVAAGIFLYEMQQAALACASGWCSAVNHPG